MSKFIFRGTLGVFLGLFYVGWGQNHEALSAFVPPAGLTLAPTLLLIMACAYAAGLKKPKRKGR